MGIPRSPTFQIVSLIVMTSCIVAWFGWWQSDRYLGVPQRAVLIEQRPDGGEAPPIEGTVTWSLNEDDVEGLGVVAHVVVPARGFDVTLSLRPNSDDGLPASHLMEFL